MGDGRWGRPDTGGGRLNTHLWTERREKGRKERGGGQDVLESKAPGRILEGGKKEGTKIIFDGKHRILKIGTESRDNHSLCSGFGTTPSHNE